MTQSADRPDDSYPSRNLIFRIKWSGRSVATFRKVSGLSRTSGVVSSHDATGYSIKKPISGQSEYGALVLEQGVTDDPEFALWAKRIFNASMSGAPLLKNVRKTTVIELLDEQGAVAWTCTVRGCWPSECQHLPDLDGTGETVIQSLVLQNDGWELDEPAQKFS